MRERKREQNIITYFHSFSTLFLCYFCTIPLLFPHYFHATFVPFLCYFNAISMLLLHSSHTISVLFPCYPQDILQHFFHVISLMMLATKAIILKQTIHWRKMACARGCYIYSHALKFFLTLTGTKSLFSEKTVSNESCL